MSEKTTSVRFELTTLDKTALRFRQLVHNSMPDVTSVMAASIRTKIGCMTYNTLYCITLSRECETMGCGVAK